MFPGYRRQELGIPEGKLNPDNIKVPGPALYKSGFRPAIVRAIDGRAVGFLIKCGGICQQGIELRRGGHHERKRSSTAGSARYLSQPENPATINKSSKRKV